MRAIRVGNPPFWEQQWVLGAHGARVWPLADQEGQRAPSRTMHAQKGTRRAEKRQRTPRTPFAA